MHVQNVIVGILHCVKDGYQRSRKMDWMDICLVADYSGDIDNADCTQWWGELEIYIWTDWELLSKAQVRAWQFSVNKRFCDQDRIASTWLKDFVYGSSTDSLRTAVEKKYDRLPDNQRGGVMYLYLTLCEMFQMSREIKEKVWLDTRGKTSSLLQRKFLVCVSVLTPSELFRRIMSWIS